MEIQAKILEIFETVEVSERFRKREFVVEYIENPQYPEFLKFEMTQDKCEMLDQFQVGDEVEIAFNLKGRKWISPQGDTKYFNSLQAWKIAQAVKNMSHQPSAVTPQSTATPQPSGSQGSSENSNLPPIEAYEDQKIEEDDLPF